MGIIHIKDSLCKVDAEQAEASIKADEIIVKEMIQRTVTFRHVNQKVRESMVAWVAHMVRVHIDQLVKADVGSADSENLIPMTIEKSRRRVSCVQLVRKSVRVAAFEMVPVASNLVFEVGSG